MGRRELRENQFMLLFRNEFHDDIEMKEQIRLFFDQTEFDNEKDIEYIKNRVSIIIELQKEIDQKIEEVIKGWDINRLAKVDLTIIRLAFYEMEYDDEIPKSVAINEAIEIAKKYAGEDSPAFINGVLAKLF